jgi:hypothetical protein
VTASATPLSRSDSISARGRGSHRLMMFVNPGLE